MASTNWWMRRHRPTTCGVYSLKWNAHWITIAHRPTIWQQLTTGADALPRFCIIHTRLTKRPLKISLAQHALYHALFRTWNAFGPDLLHCYDIKGLPPDHLALEALFSSLRRHQRRISGHKATGELRYMGHDQVLFHAESQEELLTQLRSVPLERYRHPIPNQCLKMRRQQLIQNEKPSLNIR
jgi:hypothetical protein